MIENTKEILLRITSSYFCAGIILKNNMVIKTAPILKYMLNKDIKYIINYCGIKKWKIENAIIR